MFKSAGLCVLLFSALIAECSSAADLNSLPANTWVPLKFTTEQARWADCFVPPGDQMIWEGADSPVYDGRPAGGMLDYKFPILLEEARKARYVRFRQTSSEGTAGPAAIGLWEMEVFGKVKKWPWDERLRLPEPPACGKEKN